MKKYTFIVLMLLISSLLFAQEKFKITLKSPSYNGDSMIFSPFYIRVGFEGFYKYKLNPNPNITDFSTIFKGYRFKETSFQIKIQEENILEGELKYPTPFTFQYSNMNSRKFYVSKLFFLEKGSYNIQLPKMLDNYEIVLNSPSNNEYREFKKIFSDIYVKPIVITRNDSLIDLNEKEKRIALYIKTHVNSYVALWEIIDDYTLYDFNPIYLENLKLFSAEIKKSDLFNNFENKLKNEAVTKIGYELPFVKFDASHKLSKNDFKKYKVTVIDYWSTTCAPCIKAMPELVSLYKEYRNKGVNFITITDEHESNRIELAKSILNKNHVQWVNYFDTNRVFFDKLNVTVYPLQFVIDDNGIIISRVSGDLKEIKRVIDEKLKQ